jgi:hypothetical protein
MKFLGNIVCTIAFIAQILLSAGLFMHAPDCGAKQPVVASESDIFAASVSHECDCDHHDHGEPINHDLCLSQPPAHDHDCTCSPQKTYPYLLDALTIDQKSKSQLLDGGVINSSQIDFTQLSIHLCKSNPSNGPPRPLTNLPQQQARYTSIYLGVFLI